MPGLSIATVTIFGLLGLQEGIPATTEDGQKVRLLPNGKWIYIVTPVVVDGVRGTRTRELKLPHSDASVWVDPAQWIVQSNEGIRTVLAHKNGKLFGAFASEGIGGVPLATVRDSALLNWQRLDPNAKILKETKLQVSGKSAMLIEGEFKTQGIAFGSIGYYFGGAKSNLQVVAFTQKSELEQLRKEMKEFIDGLEIREAAAPDQAPPDPGKLSAGKFELTYDSQKWRAKKDPDGTFSLQFLSGDAYAKLIAESVEIPTEALLEIAIENAKGEAGNQVEVTARSELVVGATTFRTLRFDVAPKGIPLTFWGAYWGGKQGAVQLLTYSGRNIFAKFEEEFRLLLGGLKVLD